MRWRCETARARSVTAPEVGREPLVDREGRGVEAFGHAEMLGQLQVQPALLGPSSQVGQIEDGNMIESDPVADVIEMKM